ncbi:hypothetical protein M2164_005949 [Streptomyces sp. SAI-208]|uniref:hypothetical protein n=1 Tax=Streptomyces sp. SAI-208 TaxID=2940550 RepID=UPI00247384F0|nr:hypothetical protein [Streptomyces sp. SAI-208]MDH6610314.1 hypothetical protein [Streptomyces sp. SAI-208]
MLTAYWDSFGEKIGARGVLFADRTIDIPANDTSAYLESGSRNDLALKLGDQDIQSTIERVVRQTPQGPRPGKRVGVQLADERTDIARDMDRLANWRDELADALGMGRGNSWDDIRNAAAEFRAELIRSENARERLRQDRDEARSWARHGCEIGQKHCGWTDHGVAPDWLTEGWPPHIDSCEHLKQMAEFDEALPRVRAAVARLRAATPTWGPAADVIEAALNGEQEQP